MNLITQDTTIRKFKRRNAIKGYHFVTSESEVNFLPFKKPGGAICISGPQLKSSIKDNIVYLCGKLGWMYLSAQRSSGCFYINIPDCL